MKTKCEQCHTPLTRKDTAYICSFEETYCKSCSEKLDFTCIRCQGVLVLRPSRKIKPFKVPASKLKILALANSC
ncbi:DUF1272 domain-containing protein [Shewanella pealeana]